MDVTIEQMLAGLQALWQGGGHVAQLAGWRNASKKPALKTLVDRLREIFPNEGSAIAALERAITTAHFTTDEQAVLRAAFAIDFGDDRALQRRLRKVNPERWTGEEAKQQQRLLKETVAPALAEFLAHPQNARLETSLPPAMESEAMSATGSRSYRISLDATVVLARPGRRPTAVCEIRQLTAVTDTEAWETSSTSGGWPIFRHFGDGALTVRQATGGASITVRFDPALSAGQHARLVLLRECPDPIEQTSGKWEVQGRGTVTAATLRLQFGDVHPKQAWWYHTSHAADAPGDYDQRRDLLNAPNHSQFFPELPIGDYIGIAWNW